MPTFKLNKLVRDKLREEYLLDGQEAVYRSLSIEEHKNELKNKIIEEASEINTNAPIEDIISEIADIRQAIDDLVLLYEISDDQIKFKQQTKYSKKGGFVSGAFVETITLKDNDKWLEYYRKNPDIFKEL